MIFIYVVLPRDLAPIFLFFRPLNQSQFAKGPLIVFILHILSVPAITLHLKKASEEVIFINV